MIVAIRATGEFQYLGGDSGSAIDSWGQFFCDIAWNETQLAVSRVKHCDGIRIKFVCGVAPYFEDSRFLSVSIASQFC